MMNKKQIEDEGKAQYHSWRNTRNKTNWAVTTQPSVFTGEKHDVATFIGKTSSAYNMGMETKAKEMEKAGVDPETIWQKTGTMRNYSNAWQQEIPDNEAKLTKGAASMTMALDADGNRIPINPDHPQDPISSIIRTNTGQSDVEVVLNGNAGVLDHPELYNAYQGLEEGAVTFEATDRKNVFGGVTPDPKQYGYKFYNTKTHKMDTYEGIVKTHGKDYADNISAGDMTLYGSDAWIESFKDPNTGVVNWSGVGNEIKKTMIHELQHSIQVKEGWTLGGNSNSLKPFVKSLIPEGFDFREAGHDSLDSYVDEMAYFAYKHQLGEVQARLTENRMDLTAEERRQHYPYKQGKYGLDVNPENIVKVRDRQNEFNAKTNDAHKEEGHSHRESHYQGEPLTPEQIIAYEEHQTLVDLHRPLTHEEKVENLLNSMDSMTPEEEAAVRKKADEERKAELDYVHSLSPAEQIKYNENKLKNKWKNKNKNGGRIR